MCAYEECLINGMARLKKQYFWQQLHREVFSIMQKMYEKGTCVDVVTVATEGKALFKDRTASWLMIKEAYISSSAFDHLVDKLIDLHERRGLSDMAIKVSEQVNEDITINEIVSGIEQAIYSVANDEQAVIVTPKEHASRMLDTLSNRMERKSNCGIKTRYRDINYALNGGFEPGQLIILAAQTGKGKTAFAMNLMRDIAIIQKIPGLYVNTEMNEEQMDCRWMSMLTGIDHHKIATGNLITEEFNKVNGILDHMHNSGFHSVTEPNLTMNKMISISRKFTAQKKCKVIVCDYIGRISTLDPKLQEWQVLKNAAKQLKTLAQELGVTVIMLAQVTKSERLEGAQSMENECDLYGYLRPLYDDELASMAEFNYCLDVQKNRSGPCKKIRLKFYGDRLTFCGEGDEKL